MAREQAAAVAKESEERAKARREEAWELVARLAEAEAAAEEAASREFEARKTAKVAKDELASIAEFEPVTSASKREEAKRLAEQLAYAEAVAEAERLVEEERVRILQMQEAAKQNRARTVGEASSSNEARQKRDEIPYFTRDLPENPVGSSGSDPSERAPGPTSARQPYGFALG